MLITRKSPISGEINTVDIPVTEDQLAAYHKGALLQNAFPNISPGDREFIKSGITESEWTQIFGTGEEE
jgi:hypothetical protein